MSPNSITLLTLLAPITFLVTSIASWFQPGIRPLWVKRLGMLATILSITVAAMDGFWVYNLGVIEESLWEINHLGFSFRFDAISILMFQMISLLSFIIFKFSLNYLDGDQRQGAFLGRLAAAIASVQLLVLSGNLVILWMAWVLTSVSLHRLLVFYPERPGAIIVARKKFIVARLSDLCLLGATVLLYQSFGTANLGQLFQFIQASVNTGTYSIYLEASAIFLVMAVLFKSAQFPTHGWLVEVMETPTPVSALLHAGLLNAGPYLIIRMAFLMDATTYAPLLLMTVGGFTALFASIVFMTQTSVKTMLGYSSVAHMGFSLMASGLGVYPAAMLHLVSHSFYKAHAFLSSGSKIDEVRASKVPLPTRLGNPWRIALGMGLSMTIFAAFAWIYGIKTQTQWPLLAIGAIIVFAMARILTSAIDSNGNQALVLRALTFTGIISLSFFTLESVTHHLISSQLPLGTTPSVAKLILMGLILGIFSLAVIIQILVPRIVQKPIYQAWAIHFRNGLYFNALFDRMVGAAYVQPIKKRNRA